MKIKKDALPQQLLWRCDEFTRTHCPLAYEEAVDMMMKDAYIAWMEHKGTNAFILYPALCRQLCRECVARFNDQIATQIQMGEGGKTPAPEKHEILALQSRCALYCESFECMSKSSLAVPHDADDTSFQTYNLNRTEFE
jgi:hypothetical protein